MKTLNIMSRIVGLLQLKVEDKSDISSYIQPWFEAQNGDAVIDIEIKKMTAILPDLTDMALELKSVDAGKIAL